MSVLVHRIRRQRWQVRASSKHAAFGLRQRLRAEWQEILLPALERVFDEKFGGDEVIHLARIDLDLGLITDAQIARLPELIHRQLLEQLRVIVASRAAVREPMAPPQKRSSQLHSRLSTLLHYLRTGSLPWEAVRLANGMPDVAQEMKQTCHEQWDELEEIVRRERLPAAGYFRLLQLITPLETGRLEALLEGAVTLKPEVMELVKLLTELAQRTTASHQYLELLALVLSEMGSPPSEGLVFNQSSPGGAVCHPFHKLAGSLPEPARALVSAQLKMLIQPGEADERISPALREVKEVDIKLPQKKRPRAPKTVPVLPGEESVTAALETERPSSNLKMVADFGQMVNYVGLVLLHPFLPRFFEATGLKAKDRSSLPWSALPRAAAVLYYLATGQEQIYEYEIAFIKVLLEVEPAAALCVSEGLLLEDDKLEGENLLGAAIEHWPALKGTSIAGVRRSFLQRSGLLRKDDNGWRLQVERQPFDILIEHLPWSISVIKLPWMKQPIYTEW